MEMKTLTVPLLQELIDHIDVYEAQGSGKSRTQRIVIYYRFVGYIECRTAPFGAAAITGQMSVRAWKSSIFPPGIRKQQGKNLAVSTKKSEDTY